MNKNTIRSQRFRARQRLKAAQAAAPKIDVLAAAVGLLNQAARTLNHIPTTAQAPAAKPEAAGPDDYSMRSLLGEVQEPIPPRATFCAPDEWTQYHALVAARTRNLVGDPFNRTSDEIAQHNLRHQQWWAEQDRAVAQEHHRQAAKVAAKESAATASRIAASRTLSTGASHL